MGGSGRQKVTSGAAPTSLASSACATSRVARTLSHTLMKDAHRAIGLQAPRTDTLKRMLLRNGGIASTTNETTSCDPAVRRARDSDLRVSLLILGRTHRRRRAAPAGATRRIAD